MFPLKDRYKKYPNYLRSCIEFMLAIMNSLFNFLMNYRIYQKNIYKIFVMFLIPQFSSVAQQRLTLGDHVDCSTPGFPVHHQLLELAQIHVHQAGDAIHPFHPLLSPSPPALNLSQHQGLFQGVSSLHQVSKVLEFQLQYQSFQ